jgi:hypothetical protein
MARRDIGDPDPRFRGGVRGPWPIWGQYSQLRILIWAAEFFVDAFSSEESILA